MHVLVRSLLLPAAVAGLLAACGGGVSLSIGVFDDDFDDSPDFRLTSSGRSGALNVAAATDARLNGSYAHSDVLLSEVLRFSPTSRNPETCRFQFDGLVQATGGRILGGEIRYLPGTSELRTAFILIDDFEFRQDGSTGVVVDRGANVVTFNGAVLASRHTSGQQLTLTGTVPIRAEGKPADC
jgi:hypothetical protein